MRYVEVALASILAGLTAVSAQISFRLGPIPYTMQNFAIVLAGLILSPRYAALSQLLYIALIAIGIPAASGLRGGVHVLVGYTAGYIWGFPVASYAMSRLSRWYLAKRGAKLYDLERSDAAVLLAISLLATLPMYFMGFAVFAYYALGSSTLLAWCNSVAPIEGSALLKIFVASVLVFIPQDLFMDHLLAIALAKRIARVLASRGIEL